MRGFGGGFGGAMGGVRGLEAGGIRAPTLDNLGDEGAVGGAYDHRVVVRLLTYLGPQRRDVVICLAAVLTYTAANVSIPLVLMLGINNFVNDGDLNGLHAIALVFLGVALVHFAANYIQFIFIPRIGQSVLYALRTQMFSHLQSLSPSFFHRTPVGRIMSRSQSDVLQLQETFELIAQSLADFFGLIGIVVVMLIIDTQLALVCLSVIPVLFIVLLYWQRFARRSFMRIRRAIAMVNGEYNQNITGVRVVESLNRQQENLSHFDELNREHLEANMQASRFSGALSPTVGLLTGFAIGVVIVMGGSEVLDTPLQWGVLVAFTMLIQRFFEPIRNLTMQYSQLQRAMASGVRIFEILDLKPEVKDADDAEELPEVQGDIRYEGVTFHYVPGVDVLKDIDLYVSPGETVALVGATGAGKSTLVTLLMRFADVTEGRILVDGRDIREVTRRSLVGQMSMVLQEPYLFSGTIRENIRYRHEDTTDEAVLAAAKVVGAHDFITALEMGYDTVLAERGTNLSVGQRQLISFARAIVGDPRILILDEATANIDTQTEILVQSALKSVLKGRTSIVIAHRLSTIRNADKIVVVDGGRVVEVGRHQELLDGKGLYARLYAINYGLDAPAATADGASAHEGDA